MNEKLVAFIICSNNEAKLCECKYYLNRLQIPKGYTTDTIVVTGADSMTEGYQAAMLSTEAKYKVYLHHDTFIINDNFIHDFLSVFQKDKGIGMLGVIGCRKLPNNAYACTSWDVGKVLHNISNKCLLKYQSKDKEFIEVDAIDGLVMVTQYDINWRTDIFKNWDFYDISQCYEFHRKKLKIIVPYQEDYWCYHDNEYSKMSQYDYNRHLFAKEYQDIRPFVSDNQVSTDREKSELQFQIKDMFRTMISQGRIKEVFQLINQDEILQELGCILEYSLAALINKAEKENQTNIKVNIDILEEYELVSQLQRLKFLLKRVEFHCDDKDSIIKDIINNYSVYAIYYTIIFFIINRKEVLYNLYQYYKEAHLTEESKIVYKMMEVTQDNISMER